jgi:2-octaprenyl-6-methoxyphenol hydroxylase
MAKNMIDTDVAVVGGGAIGLAAALGLAQAGIRTTLLGAAQDIRDDGRTAALMQPSIDLLREIGVMPRLEAQAWPLAAIRLIDITGALIRAPTVTFRANEIDLPHFALNMSNADIVRAMTEAGRDQTGLSLDTALVKAADFGADVAPLTLDDDRRLTARLVIAADGQKSRLREAAGIDIKSWSYDQVALTFHVSHSLDHEDISTEFHTRSGPLTFVPYGEFRSSVVWLVSREEAAALQQRTPQEVAEAAQRRASSVLGDLKAITRIGAVPMGGLIARSATAARLALAGEALHAFPPVGAQGMNLGLRDARSLVAAVVAARDAGADIGSPAALAPYERSRQFDAVSRTYGVDLLNRSLISGLLPLDMARFAGLTAAAHVGPLRRMLMRAGMGQSPLGAA